MNLWAKEEDLTVYRGDALGVLAALPDDWVDAVLTSPPYVDMRPEYESPKDWVRIFEELLRVVNGPMLWNVGRKWVEGCEDMWWLQLIDEAKEAGWEHWDTLVWFKPNANPIQGRIATNAHEYVLAFGKEGAEFDEEARRRPYAIGSAERLRRRWVSSISVKDDGEERSGARRSERKGERREVNPAGARGASVLVHTTGKEKGIKHPAPMCLDVALELVEFVCPAGGTVLDPFAGSGTTAIAARMRQCNSVMIELSPDYCAELVRRLSLVPRQMTLLP
jgi:DNA modification methylase